MLQCSSVGGIEGGTAHHNKEAMPHDLLSDRSMRGKKALSRKHCHSRRRKQSLPWQHHAPLRVGEQKVHGGACPP